MRYTFPRQSSKLSTSKRGARFCYASPEPLLYWRASRIPFSWLYRQKSMRRSTRKRSRRPVSGSRGGPLRILLDTALLLPTLGIGHWTRGCARPKEALRSRIEAGVHEYFPSGDSSEKGAGHEE